MHRIFAVAVLCSLTAVANWAQDSSSTPATPAKPLAKPATHPAAHPLATDQPKAIIETSVGSMTCTLFPDKAPIGVQNFIDLATGKKDWKTVRGVTKRGVPLYDGTIFHRVIPNFMIQGGDPAGDGTGDPGYKFKNEVSSDLTFDKPGRMAYANAGPNTNGSQFFITEVATPHLNGNYTIFGQCDEATVALVKQIARMGADPSNDRPFRPVKIIHIKIVHGEAAKAAAKPATKPASATAPKTPPDQN
jgi:peptidyl-prolyl cis-trans isomerase A (cyclophilin A)